MTALTCPQVSGRFSAISVERRLLRRAICSATSSCTQARNLLNVPSAATLAEDGMRSPVTSALMQAWHILSNLRLSSLHSCLNNGGISRLVSSIFSNYREAVQVQLLWPQLQAAEHAGGAPGSLPQLPPEPGVTAGSQRTQRRYSAVAVGGTGVEKQSINR